MATAESYEQEAEDLMRQGQGAIEAAKKLQLAAGYYSKSEDQLKRARGFLLEGVSIYLLIDWFGQFVDSDLRRVLSAIQNAEQLLDRTGDKKGELETRGWKLLTEGTTNMKTRNYELAGKQFDEARSTFRELKELNGSEMIEHAILLSETSSLSALKAQIVKGKDWESVRLLKGKIKQLYDNLRRINPVDGAFYNIDYAILEALASFDEGQKALKLWEYHEAEEIFLNAETAVGNQPKVQVRNEELEVQLQTSVEALQVLFGSARLEAQGFMFLLEKMDLKRATEKFSEASKKYRQAEEAFNKAQYVSYFVSTIKEASETTKERAMVLSGLTAKSLKEITVGVGVWFIVFFFASLGVLTWLNTYLKFAADQVLFYSFLSGIIGGLGLKSPEILEALAHVLGANTATS